MTSLGLMVILHHIPGDLIHASEAVLASHQCVHSQSNVITADCLISAATRITVLINACILNVNVSSVQQSGFNRAFEAEEYDAHLAEFYEDYPEFDDLHEFHEQAGI